MAMGGLIGWSLAGFLAGPLADRIGRCKPLLVGALLPFSLVPGLIVAVLIARLVREPFPGCLLRWHRWHRWHPWPPAPHRS